MNHKNQINGARSHRWWLGVTGVALLSLYYFYFAWPTFRVPLLWDDVMNCHYYWSRPVWELIKGAIIFFSSYFRPLGGFFYLPLFKIFGLNPIPFHVLAAGLLLLNAVILYQVTRILSRSVETSIYVALLSTWHFHLRSLYYETGMIYDILAFLFYFGCLLYYVRARESGRPLDWKITLVSAILFACALDAKEIAISLPVCIGLYEILWNPPASLQPKSLYRWIRQNGLFVLVSSIMAVVYAFGKMRGPESLTTNPAFTPHVSLNAYLLHYSAHIRGLFYNILDVGASGAGIILVSMLLIGLFCRSKLLIFSGLQAIVGFLPIAFIADRNGYAMYVPFGGWVIYVAVLAVALRDLLMDGIAAAFGKSSAMKRRAIRVLKPVPILFYLLGFVVPKHLDEFKIIKDSLVTDQYGLRSSLDQLIGMNISLPLRAKVLFMRDSSPTQTPAISFLTRLFYRDPDLLVVRAKEYCASDKPIPVEHYALVLDYEHGRYIDLTSSWRSGKITGVCSLPDEYKDQFGNVVTVPSIRK